MWYQANALATELSCLGFDALFMCWDEDNIMIVFKFFWSVGSFIIFSFFIAGTSGIVNATTQFVEIPMLTCRASQPLLTGRQNVEDEKNKFEVVCCSASQPLAS